MNSFPYFINEIKFDLINFLPMKEISNISKMNLTKYYSNIEYKNAKMYVQTPILKFIHPIQKINDKYYLYIFLIPKDNNCMNFFNYILNLENYAIQNLFTNGEINPITVKNYNLNDEEQGLNQSIKYLKLILNYDTKLEIDQEIIELSNLNIDEFNSLISLIDLKLIIDVDNICKVGNKVALNLNTLKIKIIPANNNDQIEFREEYDEKELATECPDNFKKYLNNTEVISELTIDNKNNSENASIKKINQYMEKLKENSENILSQTDSLFNRVTSDKMNLDKNFSLSERNKSDFKIKSRKKTKIKTSSSESFSD